ncbi:MAG: MATE family efflux transporter [Ruthenibacterium sp.]
MTTDMTQGSPAKILWRFTMPMLLSVVFQQLYNIADSVIAGRFIGESALAAVGASYPVTMIFMAVATGCNIGCSVVISQLFGAKNYPRMKTAISTSFISALILAALLTLGGFLTAAPILRQMTTPNDIFADSMIYLNIYVGGLFFLFLYNLCNGVFTALGDSKTPLCFLIASSLANIGMDIVFVVCFHMGVAGVAWATFLCQGVASVLAALALYRRLKTIQVASYPRFSKREFVRIAKIAVPSILQQSFISVGQLFIQTLVNGFGSAVVAGYAAAIKLNGFAIMGFSTLGSGLSNFTAQNIGAGKQTRVKQGFHAGMVLTLCVAVPFVVAYFFFGAQMVGIFMTNPSAEALQVGVEFLKIVSPFFLLISIKLMADGVLRGAGSMTCFMIATFADLVLRVVLAFVLAPIFGARGIWMSWPLGWTMATALTMLFYGKGVWKNRTLQ